MIAAILLKITFQTVPVAAMNLTKSYIGVASLVTSFLVFARAQDLSDTDYGRLINLQSCRLSISQATSSDELLTSVAGQHIVHSEQKSASRSLPCMEISDHNATVVKAVGKQ